MYRKGTSWYGTSWWGIFDVTPGQQQHLTSGESDTSNLAKNNILCKRQLYRHSLNSYTEMLQQGDYSSASIESVLSHFLSCLFTILSPFLPARLRDMHWAKKQERETPLLPYAHFLCQGQKRSFPSYIQREEWLLNVLHVLWYAFNPVLFLVCCPFVPVNVLAEFTFFLLLMSALLARSTYLRELYGVLRWLAKRSKCV